jgi:hypothetical protein
MQVSVATRSRTAAPSSLTALDPAQLDSLDLAQLYAQASGCALAAHEVKVFEQVYRVKVTRTLMTSATCADDIGQLISHLSKMRTLLRRKAASSEAATARQRWEVYVELLDTASTLAVEREVTAAPAAADAKSAWEVVASTLLAHRREGIGWGQLAELVIASSTGPTSKGGVSQLVTAMRAAGWLDAVSRGRNKLIFPGPSIHKSAAWQAAFGQGTEPAGPQAVNTPSSFALTLKLIKDSVCFNQSRIIETHHLAAEKHQRFKESQGKSAAARKKLRADLMSYLNNTLTSAANENFALLKNYFRMRGSTPPRMCIKGNWTGADHEQLVVDVIRDRVQDMTREPSRIEDNTGFVRVKESGLWYLENDLPAAALRDEYRNPRLNVDLLKSLAAANQANGISTLSREDWQRCWTQRDDTDSASCYRSTLIVPITLVNNSLSNDFIDSVKSKLSSPSKPRVDRVILGYLCFDHESANYFDAIADVQLGYIFADLLSVYLFTRFNFTSMSTTFKDFDEKLRTEEMLQQMVAKLSSTPNLQVLDNDSRDNLLVSVDRGIWEAMPAAA